MPTSCAASGSSATARIIRPVLERDRKYCRPNSTTTASTKMAIDRYATWIWSVMCTDFVASEPMLSEWLSAENTCSNRFWMTTDSPNVTNNVVSGPRSRLAWMSVRWPTYPRTTKIGTTMTNDQTAGMCVAGTISTARNAATTARSPWARLMTFIVPNRSDRPHANSAKRPPTRMPCTIALTQLMPAGPVFASPKYAASICSGLNSPGRPFERRPSLEEALDPRGDADRLAHVLLDEQHRHPGVEQLGQQAVDLPHDDRRRAERELVEQEHARVRDERPSDRHGLLLAAGELRGALARSFPHPSEQPVDALQIPGSGPGVVGADDQVLLDGERREETASLGHERHPRGQPPFRRLAGDLRPVQEDRALGRLVQTGQRAQQRRLARAVRADDRVHLAGVDAQAHAGDRTELTVEDGEIANLQDRRRPPLAGHVAPSAPGGPSDRPASTSDSAVASVPRNTSRTAGLARTSDGTPSPMMRPPAKQMSRSTVSTKARTTCSIQITAGAAFTRRAHHVDELDDLGVGQPAGHLVQQQQPGFGRERSRQLQALALQQTQRAGRPVHVVGEAGVREHRRRERVARLSPFSGSLLRGDQHVLEHRHLFERPGHLVRAADPEARPDRGVDPGDRSAVEPDLAGIGVEVAGDHAEDAGLAGAVRADDADGVAGLDDERQVLGDRDLAEPLRDVVELEQRPHLDQGLVGTRSPPIGTAGLMLLSTTTISQG